MKKLNKEDKYIFITRGLPACGKSTFIENVFKGQYPVICPDEIRLKLNGLEQTEEGIFKISQANHKEVWKTVYTTLEEEITKNRIVILDSTMAKSKDLKNFIERYNTKEHKVIIIDFSNIPYEECIERNLKRKPVYKIVSNKVLYSMYNRLKVSKNQFLDISIPFNEFENIFNEIR